MKTKAFSTLLVLSFAMSSVSQAGLSEIIGRVAGGVLGGALCNELGLGRGNGRTAMVALCAVGGSMIGGEIGRDMDENDARAFEESQRRSFDGDLDRDYDWDGRGYGSRTGIHGRIRPIRAGYHRQTREVCREYQSVTYRGNRSAENRSIVCRRNDGSFYSLEERTLFVNGQVVQQDSTERSGYDNRGGGYQPPYITPDHRPTPPRPVPYPDDRYGRGEDRRGGGRHDRRNEDRAYCSSWDIGMVRGGDIVYTRYGQSGTFQGLNRSGREAAVNVSGYIQTIQTSDLALSGCHLGISSGQLVSTRYGQQGTVAGIFSNGDLAVWIAGYTQILRRDDVFFR